MRLPDPPLLLVTDRAQARRALTEIVARGAGGGCRWVSLREKDLPEDEQVVLARMLIADGAQIRRAAGAAWRGGAGKARRRRRRASAVRQRCRRGARAAWVRENSSACRSTPSPKPRRSIRKPPIMRSRGLPSKRRASRATGRKSAARVLPKSPALARVPVLAIGGINTARVGEVMAAGCAGVAVMGGVMRAADPALEVGALVATLKGLSARADRWPTP